MGTLDDDTTGLAPVTVDPDGVHGFGAFVQDEVTHNLHPYAEDIVRLCDDDAVAFGNRLAFPALYDARTGYEASLRQAIGNLREFVTASQIIVDAVKRSLPSTPRRTASRPRRSRRSSTTRSPRRPGSAAPTTRWSASPAPTSSCRRPSPNGVTRCEHGEQADRLVAVHPAPDLGHAARRGW
ncbi:hypothetical protein ACFQX7_17175 [Luedemannella flava]